MVFAEAITMEPVKLIGVNEDAALRQMLANLAQAFSSRNLTSFSPIVIFQRASEAVAGSGINHCVSLLKQIKEYQAELEEYIRSKDAEDTLSLHLIFPEANGAQVWRTISHNPVDFATVPKFQERYLALGQSLKSAVWELDRWYCSIWFSSRRLLYHF